MVRQESSCLQLEKDARLSVSDDDHGLMQLTNPKPTSNQVYAGTKCIAGRVAPLDRETVQERTHWNKRFQTWAIATTIWKDNPDKEAAKLERRIGPETFAHEREDGKREST